MLRVKQQQRGFGLGIAIGLSGHRGGDQAVAVLHQRVAEIGQVRFLAIALLVEPGIRISRRFMRLVGALLPVEVRAVAIGAVLLAEALLRRPGLNQRAVHREVLIAHEPLGLPVHLGEELVAPLLLVISRCRFFENTAWLHTASSMPRPTNQRNSRL